MGLFDSTPTEPLNVALRRHWLVLVLFVIEPIVALAIASIFPDTPFLRALTAIPAALACFWPTAFKTAPTSYWLLACASWFAVSLFVLAFAGA